MSKGGSLHPRFGNNGGIEAPVMKSRLTKLIADAAGVQDGPERHAANMSVLRILLQHVSIVLAEEVIDERRGQPAMNSRRPLPTATLRAPADGTMVAAILDMLVIAENEYAPGHAARIWKQFDSERPCWRLLQSGDGRSAERVLWALIEIRNDRAHGIHGSGDSEAESDALHFLVDQFLPLLPTISSDGNSFVLQRTNGESYKVATLRPVEGRLLCYRSIKRSSAGKCIVRCQIEDGWFRSTDYTYETEDKLESASDGETNRYEIVRTDLSGWSPLALVPGRLTSSFAGRERELAELRDWFDDQDSRACMLYGDGGIGKTTLAVECVHRLLEGRLPVAYRPELITFYTAKKTRWGLGGLEVIRLNDVGIVDVATHIPRALEGGGLDRAWYTKSAEQLTKLLTQYLHETWGVGRNSHLLILDNTETMASSPDEVRMLAKQIGELSRKVGRVLLTSRRREAIEARHIEIKPLTDDESVTMVRARGVQLARKPIQQAGESTLRKFCRELGNKPLILEVFVQAVGEHGISLQQAFDRVKRMQAQDLGEFLYSDAWVRMSRSMQHLLLLMARLTEVHDDTLLKLCCSRVGISVMEAYDAMEESRGIAQIMKLGDGDGSHILLSSAFLEFCSGRTVMIDGRSHPTDADVDKVRSRHGEFLRSRTAKIRDRVARAYRHPYARAAFAAFRDGRDDDCEAFYELAVNADVENGWLYDRLAFFLSSRRDRQAEALDWAKKATALIPSDPDAWFTRGTIEAKQGYCNEALASLDRAASLGKHKHLCLLQQASAYVGARPSNTTMARIKVDAAVGAAPANDSLLWKFQGEVAGMRRRIDRAVDGKL